MRTPRRRLLALVLPPVLLLGALVVPAAVSPAPALADTPPAAAWGSNSEGQIGNGLGKYAGSPESVSTGSRTAADPYLQISAGTADFWTGGASACGVTMSGAAYCWGGGANGKLGNGATADSTIPVAVSVGARSADDTFASVSVGVTFACGLTGAGKAFCWGSNSYGQLGNGTQVNASAPVTVTGGLLFRNISVGAETVCGVAMDDSAYCWGSNWSGLLATGAANGTPYTSPTRISGGAIPSGTRMASVSLMVDHACALALSGAAYCWGNNGYGQLGTGNTSQSYTPVAVTGGLTFSSVQAASSFTCGTATDDSTYCWGINTDGQVGDGTTSQRTSPRLVDRSGPLGAMTVASISVGMASACARSTSGALVCWGDNAWSQIGIGTTADALSPVAVLTGAKPAGDTWAQVDVGNEFACGVSSARDAYCWGSRGAGRLGNGTSFFALNPTWATRGAIPGSETLTTVEAGNGATCAVASGGRVYCWGNGGSYVLGNGSTAQQWAPSLVSLGAAPVGTTFDRVSVGVSHACAVALDDSAYCWGANATGQLGEGSLVTAQTPVAVSTGAKPASEGWAFIDAGGDYTCGLTVPGNLYCWGSNSSGNLGTNGGNGNFPTPQAASGARTYKSLTVGNFHACAIAMDDSAYCWGSNWGGQLGDNSNVQRNVPTLVNTANLNAGEVFTSLGLGSGHTCGLTNAGRILCWGSNNDGELGTGNNTLSRIPVATSAPASGAVAYSGVTANQGVSCGLTPTRAAYCWGANSTGQLGVGTQTSSNLPVAVTPVAGGPDEFTAISAGNGWIVALGVAPVPPSPTPTPTPAPVPSVVPPGVPMRVIAELGDAHATVTWTPPVELGDPPLVSYRVEAMPSGATCTSRTTTCTIDGLTNGTAYSFRVRALSLERAGEWSAWSPAVTPRGIPSAPTSVTAIAFDDSALVTWQAPVDDGGASIAGYTATAVPGGATCSTTTTTCAVTGLANGTAYTFTVVARNAAGTSAPSAPSRAVTPQDHQAPSIVIVGSRGTRSQGDRVVIQGTTTGLVGQQAQPWVKLTGQADFRTRGKPVAIGSDGSFRWSGTIRQSARMYFTCGDVESNRIFLPVRSRMGA